MHRKNQKKQPAETNSSMATQDEIMRAATVLAELKNVVVDDKG